MKVKIYKKVALVMIMLLIGAVISKMMGYKTKNAFLENERKIPIYCVDTTDKKVALTFDVSWGVDNTDEILNILDRYNIKASFFIVGGWIDEYPEKVKEIYVRGHEIGNHSNRHPNMANISRNRIIEEIAITDTKIRNITGQGTSLFRFPEGSYSESAVAVVNDTGHYAVQWDVDSIDWKEQGADIEYNRVIKKAGPGSILLFHNNAKYTPGNLPRIIEKLTKNGYKFVKVGDLIYKENYKIDSTGKQIKYK